ncbi:MAG: LPS export ABC transporter permease LptG [Gammaproteobacteria bacterium]|nr:MAG: LPS export ABC transporter permease LptG [Gammaproteobacteria bacterium]
MRILRRYLFRVVVSRTLLVLAVLISLAGFFELISQLDNLGEGSYGLAEAFFYVLLKTPRKIFVILPMAALIGSLLGLGALAAHSEIIVMRAAGISTWRLAGALAATGLVLSVIALAIGDFVSPAAEGYARQFRALARSGQAALRPGTASWIRDGDTFINLGQPDEELRFGGVTLYRVDNGALAAVAHADSVEVTEDEQWVLNNFAETRFLDDGVVVHRVARLLEPKNLDAELLALMEVKRTTLIDQQLRRYIAYLKRNGLDARRYETAYWSRIMGSLAIVPMILIGLPLSFGSLRNAGSGARLVVGLAIGLAYFLGSQTLADGGAVFGLSPALIAALPVLVLTAVVGLMLWRAR